MELGYNTDVTLEGGTFHIQTEGRLDANPRIDTLVYRKGAVLQRVSNADEDLGVDDLHIEETKRKIRDQHLAVVALVRRSELDKIPAVQPSPTAYDFLDLLPGRLAPEWRDVLQGRHETVFEEWKKALADAMGLATPNPRHEEFREILGVFAGFLADDTLPFHRKEALLSYLLRLDARFKVIDYYEAFRRERGEVAAFTQLIAAVKRGTARLVDTLVLGSSSSSALARELLLELFTRQSIELVKFLFEDAEKRLAGEEGGARDVLPTVLLYLEEKVSSEQMGAKELDDIFDRLNYLYARLSVKAVRDISAQIVRMRDEHGVQTGLRPEQKQKVSEYIDYLEMCKEGIEKAWSLEEKLTRINEYKATIDGWDKVLRLSIGLRLALKGYHNFVTVNILETAELLAMKLRRLLPTLPPADREPVAAVLRDLQGALDANMNVRKVVVPAIKAQALLAALDEAAPVPVSAAVPAAPPAPPSPPEPVEPAPDVTTQELEAMAMGGGEGVDETRRMARIPRELLRRAAKATPGSTPEPTPLATPAMAVAPRPAAEAVAVMAPDSPAGRVRAVEERIKVGSLNLLKAIEDLTRAMGDVTRLEQSPDLDEAQRSRLLACRKELATKKKVLQQKLAGL